MSELLQDRSLESEPLGVYWYDRGDGGQVLRLDPTPYGGPPYTAYDGTYVLECLFSSAGEALGQPVAADPAFGAQYTLPGATGRTVRLGGYVYWPGFYGDGEARIQVRHGGAGGWSTVWSQAVNTLPLQSWLVLPTTDVVMQANTLDVAYGGHVPGYHVPLKSGWLWYDLLSATLLAEDLDLSAKLIQVRDAIYDRLSVIDGTGVFVTTMGDRLKGPVENYDKLDAFPFYSVLWGNYRGEPGRPMHGVRGVISVPILTYHKGAMAEVDDLAAQATADLSNALEQNYDSGSGSYPLGLGSWVKQVTVTGWDPVELPRSDATTGLVAWATTVSVAIQYYRGGA